MSTVATLFPKLLDCVRSETDTSVWNLELNLASKDDVRQLLALIDEATGMAVERHDPDLLDIAGALAADLSGLAENDTVPKPTLMLLRLIAASVAIDCAAHRKQFSIVRDWIIFSLTGRFLDENVIQLDQIGDPQSTVVDSSSATSDFVRAPFLIWAWGLFYYVRVTGDLKPIAASYLPFVERLCAAMLDELSIETLVYAGTWATVEDDPRGKMILQRLATILEKVPLPKNVSIQLAVGLSAGVGESAGLDTVVIAETALSKFKDDLNAFDRLQLLCHACAGSVERVAKHLSEIEDATREYSVYIKSEVSDYVDATFEKERSFDIIAPVVCTLSTNARVADAARLVCLWRRGGADTSASNVAVLLPTWYKGVVFAVAGGMEIANSESMSDSMLRLTNTGNAFFGTNVVLKDDNRFVANEARRPGIPNAFPWASDEYERAASEHYKFERVVSLLERSVPEGMLIVPQARDPIQPIMLKVIGRTLPIIASCAPPQPDRSVRRVCIWWASTTYGELEQRWVLEVLQRRGIEVVIPPTKSKDEFRAYYQSPDFDVFWMIGHGRFNHYYPENMSVDLTDTEEITFREWMHIDLPMNTGRRLFVGNLCDSGTTAVLGGTGELGLPIILAQSVQALIAHLWPVSSMHASIFGAVLAMQIASEQSYFDAYCKAVKIMISGRQGIETEIAGEFGATHEVIQRLRGAPDIWNKLLVWGSPAFLS